MITESNLDNSSGIALATEDVGSKPIWLFVRAYVAAGNKGMLLIN